MSRHPLNRLAAIALALGLAGLPVALAAPRALALARGRAAAAPGAAAATTTITARVPVGQAVLVAVKTNPSTGYHWAVQPVAGLGVTWLDMPTRKATPRHPLVGVPLIRVYQITARRAQPTPYVVRLVERSPRGQASGASVIVVISIQPGPAS